MLKLTSNRPQELSIINCTGQRRMSQINMAECINELMIGQLVRVRERENERHRSRFFLQGYVLWEGWWYSRDFIRRVAIILLSGQTYMNQANINSDVKITNMEADLEGSSDSDVPNIANHPSKGKIKLNPLKVQLKDHSRLPIVPPIPQAQQPYAPLPTQTQAESPHRPPQPPYAPLPQVESPSRPTPVPYGQQAYHQTHSNRLQDLSPQKQMLSNQELLSSPVREQKKSEMSSPTRVRKGIKKGYEMASFSKAVQFKDTQSYRHKKDDGDYEPLDPCGSNDDLRQFGMGVYLYFQFIKRLAVALMLISAVLIFPLMVNYQGSGLDSYTSQSFTTTLARLTIGNISNGDREDYLIITISDIISVLILFFFWVHWKSFHNSLLDQMEKDHTIVNPVRYVVAVQDFHDQTTNMKTLEMELRSHIDTLYKGAFEVQIVYNYNGNFDKFIELEEYIEDAEKEHQIIKQTTKSDEKLKEIEQKLQKKEEEILAISQAFEPTYAFIHFKTLKAKITFLNHCRHFKLQKTFAQGLSRAICCTPPPPERTLFLGKFPLMLKNTKISRPEEINWRNMDLTGASRGVRWVCSIICVVIAIAITSALIGFCTLYVASSSNCQKYVAPTGVTTAAQVAEVSARNSESDTFCYCNANIASIYSDSVVGAFCSSITNKVLITNVLQVSASVLSSVTNVILAIIIALIAKYLLRPANVPKQYVFIFWGVLCSSFINTCIIPLLLSANIFGVEFYSYLKFINFIDFNKLSIFNDFTTDWYALISPYYLTFMIIGCFMSPFIGLVVFSLKNCIKLWRLRRKCEDNDKQDPLIQKEANQSLLGLQFEYAEETAMVMLLVLIGILYSGLIPLMIPILAFGLIWIYLCKKTIIAKYSIKIPADEALNESVINLFPFIIFAHACFSVWSHTTPGVFATNAPLIKLNFKFFSNDLDRIFADAMIVGEAVFMLVVILLEFTLINFFGWLSQCCKDEMEVPVQWAAIENTSFADRIQKSNILGSYKIVNHPVYGHAMKAYNELIHRGRKGLEETKDALNQEFS